MTHSTLRALALFFALCGVLVVGLVYTPASTVVCFNGQCHPSTEFSSAEFSPVHPVLLVCPRGVRHCK